MIYHRNKCYEKGTIFWYRVKGQVFGAIVIEIQDDSESIPLYLVLISEKLSGIPVHISEVLNAKSFTLAWFDTYSLLSPLRIHIIDKIEIIGNYHNTFGLFIESNGAVVCKNIGQSETWKHSFSSYSFPEESMQNVLVSRLGISINPGTPNDKNDQGTVSRER